MIVWFALLIPILVTAALVWRFHHQVHAGEVALMLGVPTILVCAGKHLADTAATHDVEYLGDFVVTAEYLEDWNETVPCRHPKYRTVGTGKNRHTVFAGYHHLYDVDYHPAQWWLRTATGRGLRAEPAQFDALCLQWKRKTFVELRRRYHTNDGDKWETAWDQAADTLVPVVVPHAYENRVQAAGTVFAFPAIDPAKSPVFAYPPIDGWHRQPAILGGEELPRRGEAALALERANGTLGPEKQVKVFLCVFKDRPLQAGLDQEAYWKGGNKNEFVVCVGVDGRGMPQWAYPFSWTKADDLKIAARNQLLGGDAPLDLPAYVAWLAGEIRARWRRRDFAEFNYLTVDPPAWAVVLVYLLTMAACGGLGAWAVLNDLRPEHGDPVTDAWKAVRGWTGERSG